MLKIGNEIKLSFKDDNKLIIIKIDNQRRIYVILAIKSINEPNKMHKNFSFFVISLLLKGLYIILSKKSIDLCLLFHILYIINKINDKHKPMT